MTWDFVLSCWLNWALFGDRNEPVCSRAWRKSLTSHKWDKVCKCLDYMLGENHCYEVFIRHARRRR